MSSSAEQRLRGRVLREGEARSLPMASIVSPRGTLVIPASDHAANDEAPSMEEQLAAERRAGFEEGRESALADAHLAVELERTEALKAMAAQLAASCAAMTSDRRAVVDEVVSEAVDLAFELVEVLLSDELAHSDSPVRNAVARAVAMAPDGEDIRVRVHPGTIITPAELEELAAVGAVSILPDPSIEPTGCIVEAGACRIDAQIGPALERVRAVLDQARAQARESVLK